MSAMDLHMTSLTEDGKQGGGRASPVVGGTGKGQLGTTTNPNATVVTRKLALVSPPPPYNALGINGDGNLLLYNTVKSNEGRSKCGRIKAMNQDCLSYTFPPQITKANTIDQLHGNLSQGMIISDYQSNKNKEDVVAVQHGRDCDMKQRKCRKKQTRKNEELANVRPTGRRHKFPMKLMLLLDIPKHHEIVSWDSNGDAFTIHKPELFETQVLPNYFQTKSKSRMDDFMRKLHLWGFQTTNHKNTILCRQEVSRIIFFLLCYCYHLFTQHHDLFSYQHKIPLMVACTWSFFKNFRQGEYLLCKKITLSSTDKKESPTPASSPRDSYHAEDTNISCSSSTRSHTHVGSLVGLKRNSTLSTELNHSQSINWQHPYHLNQWKHRRIFLDSSSCHYDSFFQMGQEYDDKNSSSSTSTSYSSDSCSSYLLPPFKKVTSGKRPGSENDAAVIATNASPLVQTFPFLSGSYSNPCSSSFENSMAAASLLDVNFERRLLDIKEMNNKLELEVIQLRRIALENREKSSGTEIL